MSAKLVNDPPTSVSRSFSLTLNLEATGFARLQVEESGPVCGQEGLSFSSGHDARCRVSAWDFPARPGRSHCVAIGLLEQSGDFWTQLTRRGQVRNADPDRFDRGSQESWQRSDGDLKVAIRNWLVVCEKYVDTRQAGKQAG